MGDILIGSSTPQLTPQETIPGTPSAASQTHTDKSINDAKSVGLDFGKDVGSDFLDQFFKKDHTFSFSLEHAFQDATKDLGKTAINVFTKQLTNDPQSNLRFLLSESGDGYFYPAKHDLFSQSTETQTTPNGTQPDLHKDKKGFDWEVGFPKLGLTPNGSPLDALTKGISPERIKDISVGEKIELSYRTSVVDVKVGVEADGSLGFNGAKHWSQVNKTLLEKQGQGSVTPSLGLNIHPNENFSLSIEAGTQLSSKVTGPDNHRTNTLDAHVGVQLTINLPGDGNNPKKEALLRKENPPKEDSFSGRDADAVMRFVNERFKIEVPAPVSDKAVQP